MLADKPGRERPAPLRHLRHGVGFRGRRDDGELVYRPFFEVERRKYRFRILNGAVSRFFKISLSDASPMIQIATTATCCEPGDHHANRPAGHRGALRHRHRLLALQHRADGVDGDLLAHEDGTEPSATLSLSSALNGSSTDPCVGRFLEFRIVRIRPSPIRARCSRHDPNRICPRFRGATARSCSETVRSRRPTIPSLRSRPWGIGTGSRRRARGGFRAHLGCAELRHPPRSGTGERTAAAGIIRSTTTSERADLKRTAADNVPAWEKGRRRYRLAPDGRVQYHAVPGLRRMFMSTAHTLHGTSHVARWEIDDGGSPFLRPCRRHPTPQGVRFQAPRCCSSDQVHESRRNES